MKVKKEVTYKISVDQEEYNALVYTSNIMMKLLESADDSVLLKELNIDLETLEEKQDLLYSVAETITFCH